MKNLLRLTLFIFALYGQIAEVKAQDNTYPNEYRLFHIERSKNRNLVCYDVNLKEGKPDKKKPIEVYWIDREDEPGQKKGLNFVQEKFAYGYKVSTEKDETSQIKLKAYPDRILTLQEKDGHYVCLMSIDNQTAILKKLYVKAKENDSLSVEYVELFGENLENGKPVSEKVYK